MPFKSNENVANTKAVGKPNNVGSKSYNFKMHPVDPFNDDPKSKQYEPTAQKPVRQHNKMAGDGN